MAGCGAGEAIGDTVGGVTGQVQNGIEAVPVVANLACDAERTTLQTAIEAFTLLEGAPPAAESDLVTEGYVKQLSALFDLDASGTLVPASGSTCA